MNIDPDLRKDQKIKNQAKQIKVLSGKLELAKWQECNLRNMLKKRYESISFYWRVIEAIRMFFTNTNRPKGA